MLRNLISIGIFGAFLLVAGFFAVVLWGSLFGTEKIENQSRETQRTQAEQQHPGEQFAGSGAITRGSNPTENAIAEYTKWLAIFTALLVLATIALFVSGERNVEVARQSANAAKNSAEIAKETLISTNRPWISIVAPTIESQLTWEEKGARVTIGITVNNVGKNPAFDITVEVYPFVMGPENHDIGAAVRKFCGEVRQRQIERAASGQSGDVLFPNESLPQHHGLLFARQEVEQGAKSMGINFFSPVVVICVDYNSSVTKKSHATGLAYVLLSPPPQPGELPKLLTPDQELHSTAIYLARTPFGSFAD
jgi:hypothetical protein